MALEQSESKSINDEKFKEEYGSHILQKVKEDADRKDRSRIGNDVRKWKKFREPLDFGEKNLVLAERLKKKDMPGRLYNSTTENKPHFNKDKIFIIRKRVHVDEDVITGFQTKTKTI